MDGPLYISKSIKNIFCPGDYVVTNGGYFLWDQPNVIDVTGTYQKINNVTTSVSPSDIMVVLAIVYIGAVYMTLVYNIHKKKIGWTEFYYLKLIDGQI